MSRHFLRVPHHPLTLEMIRTSELNPHVHDSVVRAGGGSVCQSCGLEYYDHPEDGEPDQSGYQYLNRLCDGRLVKL